MVQIIIAVVVTLIIAVPITAYVSSSQCRKKIELTMGNAEDKAREIIDEALKTAEAKKREGLLEVKEESCLLYTSQEENTPAAEMPDQVDEEVKKDRQAEIMELQQDIAFDKDESMVGRTVLAMIEGKVADENAYVARTYRDAPNVDGYLFINTSKELMTGDFVQARRCV